MSKNKQKNNLCLKNVKRAETKITHTRHEFSCDQQIFASSCHEILIWSWAFGVECFLLMFTCSLEGPTIPCIPQCGQVYVLLEDLPCLVTFDCWFGLLGSLATSPPPTKSAETQET